MVKVNDLPMNRCRCRVKNCRYIFLFAIAVLTWTLRNIRTNIVCCSWCVDVVVVAAAAAHDDSFLWKCLILILGLLTTHTHTVGYNVCSMVCEKLIFFSFNDFNLELPTTTGLWSSVARHGTCAYSLLNSNSWLYTFARVLKSIDNSGKSFSIVCILCLK